MLPCDRWARNENRGLIQHLSLPDHVTPYDKFAWSDADIERLLVSGEHGRDLAAYFGEREYRDLQELARRAARAPLAEDAIRVFVVPGIMGSQLGIKREPPLPHDILWLDPIDIQVGRLSSLHLSAGAPIVPLGVVLYSYLRLKLNLRASGFSPVLYDYDWRRGVDELGAALAERIRNEPGDRIMIVAHSMGGLVSRAALTHPGMSNVERLVLLGTPNFGSFAPLQALRGTYAVVRKISSLVSTGSPESLAGKIFNTFPSLYQMLPSAQRNGGADLFNPAEWPRTGPRPNRTLLRNARNIQSKLVQADERICVVVGVGQETVTAVVKRKDDFLYTITRNLARDVFRKQVLHDSNQPFLSVYFDVAGDTPSQLLEQKELSHKISKAMDKLPEHLRKVFVLRFIDGCGHKEISETLQITPVTSRVFLARALQLLRADLSAGAPFIGFSLILLLSIIFYFFF